MKLQQLRFFKAVVDNDLNISAAAEVLFTSQPGISKQLKLLEQELGVQLFQRSGKSLTELTDAGHAVLERSNRILTEVRNIKSISQDFEQASQGELSIATTHTQARYVLPQIIRHYREQWPGIRFNLHQGTTEQISQLLADGHADLAIASGSGPLPDRTVKIPCYSWQRVLLVPKSHPFARQDKPVSLQQLAGEQLITYSFSVGKESSLLKVFGESNLTPDVVLTARDADVIKTYVKLGMGIGLIAEMAVEQEDLKSLVRVDTSHLFEPIETWVAHRSDTVLRGYAKSFIEQFTQCMQSQCGGCSQGHKQEQKKDLA